MCHLVSFPDTRHSNLDFIHTTQRESVLVKPEMLTNKPNAIQLIVTDVCVHSRQSVLVNPFLISSLAPTVTKRSANKSVIKRIGLLYAAQGPVEDHKMYREKKNDCHFFSLFRLLFSGRRRG